MSETEIAQVSTPVAAPAAEAVSEAPAAAFSAPAVETVASAAEAPKVEAPAAESLLAAPETPAEVKTETPKEAEVKPEAKADDKKPEEVKTETKPEIKTEEKTVETVEAPKYDAFKLPENFKADDKALGEFSTLLGQLEIAKGDHKATQETGQKLVDLFTAKLSDAVKQQEEYYVTLHNQNQQKMLDELKADPHFGGAGDPVAQAKAQLEMHSFLQRNVPKQELADFSKFVKEKGIDNALPVAKLINTLKQKIDRYENESAKMLPGTKPQAATPSHPGKGIMQKLYGTKA